MIWGFQTVALSSSSSKNRSDPIGKGKAICVARFEKAWSDRSSRRKPFTYRSIPDCEGPRAWTVAKSRCRSEGLELMLRGAVLLADRLRLGLQNRSRSLLCFVTDDGLSVNRGNLNPSRRWVGLDGGAITDSWPRGVHSILSQPLSAETFRRPPPDTSAVPLASGFNPFTE